MTLPDRGGSIPERVKATVAYYLHALWPERPEHFCRDNGCQLGYLAFVNREYHKHLADITAENKRLRAGIRELQHRFECRETLHTSDFTRIALALDKDGRDGRD